MFAARTNCSRPKNIEIKSEKWKSNVQASTSKFQKIVTLHQSYINHSFNLFFILFIFGYFSHWTGIFPCCRPDEYAEPPSMHCTGKQDTIYIYNTSDRSKQKLLVDVLIYFSFWHPKWLPTFLGYLMLIKIKYGRYNNSRVRTHESDSEVTIRWLGKIIQRIFFFAQSGASIRRAAWKWSGETRFPGTLTLL